MAKLSSKNILKEKKTKDPNSITSLILTHKALTDVSCLREFKNLERLDLSSNNLTSLEGLKECVNLKWLSVVQNKLQSLRGIEGLTKLTVLNAGKNLVISMDEVRQLTNLRALILNVLSRNPISSIGESLPKVKSVIKTIGSVKSCTELKELRLAHNDIRTLPSELVHNAKLQLLDVGNNLISSVSDLKVLSLLSNLKSLNVQGNPVAEKEKSIEKIRKLVPNIRIFNAKPIDRKAKEENDDGVERINNSLVDASESPWIVKTEDNEISNQDTQQRNSPKRKDLKRRNDTSSQALVGESENHGDDTFNKEKKKKRKTKKVKNNPVSTIDDPEVPFTDLFGDMNDGQVVVDKVTQHLKTNSSLISSAEKKKIKSRDKVQALQLSPGSDIGLGGSSTWGD